MKRVAIYARFSTNNQTEKSIVDQVAQCEEFCRKKGWHVFRIYSDSGKSGVSIHGRPELQALLEAALKQQFDILLTESMSRVARNIRDRVDIREMLESSEISLWTPTGGEVNQLVDEVTSVMDSQYRREIKKHVSRGMEGNVREGRSNGGDCYGYRSKPEIDAGGKWRMGQLEVVPEEAEVVRRIFAEYAQGRTPRQIAMGLNADGIHAPRKQSWYANTINGSRSRGTGILNNKKYIGLIVWGKTKRKSQPSRHGGFSPKVPPRLSVTLPADAHKVSPYQDHLRIIDDELWQKVQNRRTRLARQPAHKFRAPKRLLSGLLRCGSCGGSMVIHDTHRGKSRIRCSNMREAGICDNRIRPYLHHIEQKVCREMAKLLRDPRLIELYVDEFNKERERRHKATGASRGRVERRLAASQRELQNLVISISKGILTDEIAGERVTSLRAEQLKLQEELATIEATSNVVVLHPASADRAARTRQSSPKWLASFDRWLSGSLYAQSRPMRVVDPDTP